MRTERALEIVESPNNIEVVYNNTPIWIDSVDESSRTARIRLIKTDRRVQVSVDELSETGRNAGC